MARERSASDPKSGNPDDYPEGHGPQGDIVRIFNHVRAVRDLPDPSITPTPPLTFTPTQIGTPGLTPTLSFTPTQTDTSPPTPIFTPTQTPTLDLTSSKTPTPAFGFDLCTGLNLISLPVENPDLNSSSPLLADICGGEADALWWFDCISRTFRSWTFLDTGTGWSTWSGIPVWVNINNPAGCVWSVIGTVNTSISFDLCNGLNMVSLPVYSTSITTASELMAAVPNCTAVYGWKKEKSCANDPIFNAFFDISDIIEDYIVSSGYAYWINVTSPGTWTPPNP